MARTRVCGIHQHDPGLIKFMGWLISHFGHAKRKLANEFVARKRVGGENFYANHGSIVLVRRENDFGKRELVIENGAGHAVLFFLRFTKGFWRVRFFICHGAFFGQANK